MVAKFAPVLIRFIRSFAISLAASLLAEQVVKQMAKQARERGMEELIERFKRETAMTGKEYIEYDR